MKEITSSENYLNLLFAQDTLLSSQEFEEHRRKVIERLAEAQKQEKRARRTTIMASAGCVILFIVLYSSALLIMRSGVRFPEWLLILIALFIILLPLSALLLSSVYFFRYRWELARARREARSQALLEMPRQIAALRKELDELRAHLPKEPHHPTQKPANGFTLLEMLLVVAVIGVLSALLLPGVAAAKARSRTTICRNNLKQMAHGLAMYESDYGFLPGCGDVLIPTNHFPWQFPSTNSWIFRILPYVGPHSEIFSCPDYQPHLNWNKTLKSDSFGYNAGGSTQIYVNMEMNLGLGFGRVNFIRSVTLASAADMIELGDLQLPDSVWGNVISPWHKQPLGNIDCVIPKRHSGGANMVFCDGHVQGSRQAHWTSEDFPARSRWNNDHQPHPETW